MQELYYFKIEGISKDTHDKIIEFVKSINPELEFESSLRVD